MARQAMCWSDRHVLITGGSRGIGAGIARRVARQGARVSLVARGVAELEAVAAGTGASWRSVDVADDGCLGAAVDELAERNGPVDVLVCCAGFALPGHFADCSAGEFSAQMRVNYDGTVNAVRAVLPAMVARRGGRLVLTSSTAGCLGVVGYSSYGPSKAAVAHFARCLRYELDGTGVSVATVFPPDTDTPGFRREATRKPVETEAMSRIIGLRSVDEVVEAVMDGIDRGRTDIGVDPLTRFVLAWSTLPERVARPIARRAVGRARSGPSTDPSAWAAAARATTGPEAA